MHYKIQQLRAMNDEERADVVVAELMDPTNTIGDGGGFARAARIDQVFKQYPDISCMYCGHTFLPETFDENPPFNYPPIKSNAMLPMQFYCSSCFLDQLQKPPKQVVTDDVELLFRGDWFIALPGLFTRMGSFPMKRQFTRAYWWNHVRTREEVTRIHQAITREYGVEFEEEEEDWWDRDSPAKDRWGKQFTKQFHEWEMRFLGIFGNDT